VSWVFLLLVRSFRAFVFPLPAKAFAASHPVYAQPKESPTNLYANSGSNLPDVYKPFSQNAKDMIKTSVSSEQITTDRYPSLVAWAT